jgi:hypothetical protein
VRIDCSSCNEGGLLDSLSRGWRQHVGAQMNGSDDEQHDAHVKCYRITVAVAYGDAVAAAYDKHLAKAGSTDERDVAYRAYVDRVSSARKDAPPTSSPEQLPGDEGAFIRVTASRERDQQALRGGDQRRPGGPVPVRARATGIPPARWRWPGCGPRSSVRLRLRSG